MRCNTCCNQPWRAPTVDSALHLHPGKLRGTLHAMIDGITPSTETIIFGYGLCFVGMLGRKERGQSSLHKGLFGQRIVNTRSFEPLLLSSIGRFN